MVIVVPARGDLTALADQASRIVPLGIVGFVRPLTSERASVLIARQDGLVQHAVPTRDLPDSLQPTGADPRESELRGFADAAIASTLLGLGVERIVSVAITSTVPGSRFWIGTTSSEPSTQEQMSALQAVAASAAQVFDAPTRPESAIEQLTRLELAHELLPVTLRVHDIDTLADRLAAAAQQVLPHDHLRLRLFSDAMVEVEAATRHASIGLELPRASSLPTPGSTWEFEVLDELPSSAERVGTRSSLRLALRIDDRVIGALEFFARDPARFSGADVAIGRRLAEQVTVALAHQRLAEEGQRATALQERATNLEVLDGLLATLTGVLDVREVFDRVSAIAQKVLPHDAMSISELIENGEKVRIHASYGLGPLNEPYDMVLPEPRMASDVWDYRLIDDVRQHPEYAKGPGWAAGMRSMLFVEIRFEGRNYGGLNFYSKAVARFGRDDMLVARRITDHVALALSHRRLAEEARRNQDLRARTTSLELLDALLSALTDTGDIRSVFEATSAAVKRVLPHDGAALILRMANGQARIHASSGFPLQTEDGSSIPDTLLQRSDWEHDIVGNLQSETAPLYARWATLGFRSSVRVPIHLDGRFTGALALLASGIDAFKQTDVLVVRRMADRLAVALARDREIAASQRADEATARAARLEARVRALTDELDARTGYRRVIGESAQWRQVLTQAAQVAATDTTVLLLGESGTGKEVVARFLHRGSRRSSGPYVALNCAALPEQLLEAELFGYERGAFTGAMQSKPGQLEQAAGGTLFLDEVAEMSTTAQPKFLRVLQEREFQRLGGTRVLRADARIVAATNRDLQRSISLGQFREDLYYRLNVFAIRLPPLRERREDILPLSEAFIAELGRALGRPPAGISRDAKQMLIEYAWPGNVRELRNVLERAAILCDGGLITADFLALNVAAAALPARDVPADRSPEPSPVETASLVPPPVAAAAHPPSPPPAEGDLHSMERAMIERALQNAKFNKSKAAKALGLTRHQLYNRMRRHGFEEA